jgi:hypothetical protein
LRGACFGLRQSLDTGGAFLGPLRAIFYTQTDWLRLATKLAAQPSPCAQYYVSVPPLAAAKTSVEYPASRLDTLREESAW